MTVRPRHAVLAGLAVLLLGAPGTPASAEVPGPSGGWTLRPVAGADAGRPYVYAEGAPGTVLEDRLAVTNPGAAPLTVRLAAEGPGSTGDWVAFAAATVTVPPRTRADVPFTVTLPGGTPPGRRTAAVTATAPGREGRRASVPVHLRITGPSVAALSVEDVTTDGTTVRYTLVNRGNTVLRPRVEIHGDGVLGTAFRRAVRDVPAELLPGRRATGTDRWGDAPFLDTVDIRVTATAGPGVRNDASASASFVPWPWLVASTAVPGGAAFLLVRRARRRSRDAEPSRTEQPMPKKAGAR
ncbi:hypothetical protein [Streptomyces sp. NPDC058953]|uniref:COG1470 family protein n=1 Tax=unclassified Streptomyces TaxID=2593676 RepID=UPI0036786272